MSLPTPQPRPMIDLTSLTDEQQLMLYVSGELSPAQRSLVEERLASDGSLRGRLDEIVSLDDALAATRPTRDPIGAAVLERSIRQTSSMMRHQMVAKPQKPAPVPWRMNRFVAAGVAAAVVATAAAFWLISGEVNVTLPAGQVADSAGGINNDLTIRVDRIAQSPIAPNPDLGEQELNAIALSAFGGTDEPGDIVNATIDTELQALEFLAAN